MKIKKRKRKKMLVVGIHINGTPLRQFECERKKINIKLLYEKFQEFSGCNIRDYVLLRNVNGWLIDEFQIKRIALSDNECLNVDAVTEKTYEKSRGIKKRKLEVVKDSSTVFGDKKRRKLNE